MRLYKSIFFTLFVVQALLGSCTKEQSLEAISPDHSMAANDCSINTIIPINENSGKGYGSLQVTSGNNQLTSLIQWYDSSSQRVDYKVSLTYINDSIKLNKKEFFLTDAMGRIIEFNKLENPSDANSVYYKYLYKYDSDGFLTDKEWFIPSLNPDIPLFIYTYGWLNGNLIKIEVREADGDKRLVLKAELHYDETKTVKNFLYIMPDSDELAPYILSVNLGKKSKNLLQFISIDIYDAEQKVVKTYTTEFKNYQFSSEGNISELVASGDMIDGLPLVNGRTKFEYNCK